jgi:hypothetical protein
VGERSCPRTTSPTTTTDRERRSLTAPQAGLYDQIAALAERNGRPVSWEIRFALQELLERNGLWPRPAPDLRPWPTFRDWNGVGSLVAFVMSLNVHRRHLTPSQRAAIAAEAEGLFKEEAKERRKAGGAVGGRTPGRGRKKADSSPPKTEGTSGEAVSQAAKAMGVSRTQVYEARKLPAEMREKVKSGAMTIPEAKRAVSPPSQAPAAASAAGLQEALVRAVERYKADHPALNIHHVREALVSLDRLISSGQLVS